VKGISSEERQTLCQGETSDEPHVCCLRILLEDDRTTCSFLFLRIVLSAWTDPALEVGEAIERIERGHGEEVDLFHFLDDRMGMGK
jgi:hypothetical protein